MNLAHPESLLFWNTITFLILLFLLSKYAWKPIMKSVKEREASINSALEAAEEAKKEMQNLKANNERLLADARVERDLMLKEAREMKDKIVAEAKEEAQREGDKLIKQAKDLIDSEKKVALAQLKDQIAALSIEMAQKIMINELVDTKKQTVLINNYLKDVTLN
ncbi:ATP synthase F0, B subunit [Capnocytophaga sp. oral taxon 332 str. F0381]|uniref:F0F1 ATP synthase subunit B n=1 Tax=Capnocytophaga sp. oral taxon 332 TaxID=712213 RepID=UPI0002A217E8|nr:F0F1 ATP synthase subunit B [Capnocytophaga sp. oral taxon 332]EKY08636.1 ATP synthase F0, B subunit [Capnocytophaga sp. oral taxon 332 str. F0381]